MSNNFQVVRAYFESVMGKPLDQIPPVSFSGRDVAEIVWPLNEVFRPFLTRIRTISYDPKYEAAADNAIERYVKNPVLATWNNLPGGVWRVLLERHQQLIMMAFASDIAGNTKFTSLPLGLPENARLGGIMLFWLHGMKLPFPIEDRAAFELPSGTSPASMTLH